MRALLERINHIIYVWTSKAEHGKELSEIVKLFGMLEMAGRPAAIPKVTWDPAGLDAVVRIGQVWRYYC